MITRAFAERYRDSFENGMTVDEYVEFFHDCQKSAPEDTEFAALDDADLRELAEMVIEINGGNKWYAVMNDQEDNDWGFGSFDLDTAKEMCKKRLDDYPDTYIAIIDNGDDPICIGELHPDEF